MSQRLSGYKRKERDLYETPAWVTQALVDEIAPILPVCEYIWEPASGGGKIAAVLQERGYRVLETDIAGRDGTSPLMGDFLCSFDAPQDVAAIVTNPPYAMAQQFVEKALQLMQERHGTVAMLLRVDWDSAASRSHLFADCPQWYRKIVLTKRVVWFDGGSSPSFNHAWFCWYWRHDGPPTIGYAP